jgi:CheY-like chemotaxis protein
MRILVGNDHSDVRKVVAVVLRVNGHDTVAQAGARALWQETSKRDAHG